MRARRRTRLVLTAFVLAGLLTGCAVTSPAPSDTATASVDRPQPLTAEQAELLAAMPFRTYGAGIMQVTGQILGGQHGDLAIAGWVDFEADTGYARVAAPNGAPILVIWDTRQIAFLDVTDGSAPGTLPPLPVAGGDWQVSAFDPGASEVTRMLAALLLLSEDRPDNAALLRQSGARFLGDETIGSVPVQRFSGAPANAQAGGDGDLGTQYWVDSEGMLVRFGLRLADRTLSTVELSRSVDGTDEVPRIADLD